MALSGNTDFAITRDQLIIGALRVVGAIAQGEVPTTVQITEAGEALNMLIKSWQAMGMSIWVTKEYPLTLLNGVSTYVPTTKLLKVIQAFNRNTITKIDIPMRILTRDEYNRLGNKTSTGNPIQLYHEPQLTTSSVKVFPVPSAVEAGQNTIIMVYQKEFDDMDTGTDNPEFPHEFFDALKFGLASRLSFEYGMELADIKNLQMQAEMLKQDALSFGTEEGSMYLQVDVRYW